MENYIKIFAKQLKNITVDATICDCCAMVSNQGQCTFKGSEENKLEICEEIKNKNNCGDIFYE